LTETQPVRPSLTLPPQLQMEEEDRRERHRELMQFQASDFQAWRHHPLTRAFLRFLADYRDDCYRRAFTAFLAGGLAEVEDSEMLRGRYALADELLGLDWAAVCGWYGFEPMQKEGDDHGPE
jgi:hypothetical protein